MSLTWTLRLGLARENLETQPKSSIEMPQICSVFPRYLTVPLV